MTRKKQPCGVRANRPALLDNQCRSNLLQHSIISNFKIKAKIRSFLFCFKWKVNVNVFWISFSLKIGVLFFFLQKFQFWRVNKLFRKISYVMNAHHIPWIKGMRQN